MCFGKNPQIIFVPVISKNVKGHSIQLSILPSICRSVFLQVVGTLCMQFLLQFYSDSFEILQVFRSWSVNVHIGWIYSSDHFCYFFSKMNLIIFWPK